MIKEAVFKFGPNKSLIGILSQPAPDDLIEGSPVAVLLNAGITHRIGPFRLHVHLARELALQGFRVLRLDLSGLGDSFVRAGKLSADERAKCDVEDAFDALTAKLGVDRFVLIGLCSGAYNSHRVSVADERVVGAVFMDGIVFRTLGFYVRDCMRFLRPRIWRNFFKRKLYTKAPSKSQAEAKEMAASIFFDNEVSRETTKQELRLLVDRGVRMLFLYTDGYDDICGRAQFKEMYGLEPNTDLLQLEYYEKTEHTYRLTANRNVAIDRVANWFKTGFSSANDTASARQDEAEHALSS